MYEDTTTEIFEEETDPKISLIQFARPSERNASDGIIQYADIRSVSSKSVTVSDVYRWVDDEDRDSHPAS